LVARHRSTPRAIARRRSPPPRSPVAAAGPRGILLFLIVRARVARRLRRVARAVRPSRHPSIHPHREKAPCRGPPRRSRIDFFARSDGADGRNPADGRDEIERDEIERDEIERTNEGAREETARARRRDPAVSLPSSFLRSFAFVRSFASSRGRCVRTKITNLSCLNGLWVLVRRKHPEKIILALSLG
jgi:hypothetical protein